jgi:hypothetical protein
MKTLFHRTLSLLALATLLLASAPPSQAWIDDTNGDKIDDRITRVHLDGIAASYVNDDPSQRQIIAVTQGATLRYGVYVGYDHHPTASDVSALRGLGLTTVRPYEFIDYVRSEASYDQIVTMSRMSGVRRIEAIPMVYATNHYGSRVVRARDSRGLKKSQNYTLFPSARQELGLDGTGIVVAVLDTGVNDDQDPFNGDYPGHESLRGKFLGGGNFYLGDPNLNTPLDSSENPNDHGAAASSYHATHVAGTIMGTGGTTGFFAGVAPAARLVDCKVLSDAGAGFGSADGIEWCIHNRNNGWGLTGADTIYAGIDVLSMSLGGTSSSDGSDAGALMVNAAVEAGLVVCIASGNDSSIDYIASPGAADAAITVGASSHASTLERSDDTVTDFSNEGPRLDDGDADHFDEMKPNVVAPGDAIMSADGDFTSAGESYQSLSGTSMATPHVSGVCALILQANPSLTPLQVRSILQNTAEHNITSVKGDRPNDPFGLDANYDPGCGWGLVDVYAGAKEAMNSTDGVQVTQISAVARPTDHAIDVSWITQREYAFQGFDIYRAPDAGGVAGAFEKVNGPVPVPPSMDGDPNLENDDNRVSYAFVDADPALELGHTYWCEVRWIGIGGGGHAEPPVPADFGGLPRVATVFYNIAHNEPDNDLLIHVGTSAAQDPHAAELSELGGGVADQDSFAVNLPANDATAIIGYIEHMWSMGFSEVDNIGSYLPPSTDHPWFLNVAEGGYINRMGRVTTFSMFVNDSPGSSSGATYVTDAVLPMPTIETQEITLWIRPAPPSAAPEARLEAIGVADGVRILFQVENLDAPANVRVFRGVSPHFEERTEITGGSLFMSGGRLEYLDRAVSADGTYWYWVDFTNGQGSQVVSGPVMGRAAGAEFARTSARMLGSNPVVGACRMQYVVGRDVAPTGEANVRFVIHDANGRAVRDLSSGPQPTGRYDIEWDGRDEAGRPVPAGFYFARITAGTRSAVMKLTMLR